MKVKSYTAIDLSMQKPFLVFLKFGWVLRSVFFVRIHETEHETRGFIISFPFHNKCDNLFYFESSSLATLH